MNSKNFNYNFTVLFYQLLKNTLETASFAWKVNLIMLLTIIGSSNKLSMKNKVLINWL